MARRHSRCLQQMYKDPLDTLQTSSTHSSSSLISLCCIFHVFYHLPLYKPFSFSSHAPSPTHLPPFVFLFFSSFSSQPFLSFLPHVSFIFLFPRLNQQQISELRSQVEELQKALQEQDSKNEDVSRKTGLLLICPLLLLHNSTQSS